MGSKPEVRERIVVELKKRGAVRCHTMVDLKDRLGMGEVSVTQFRKALGSLQYKSGCVRLLRPRDDQDDLRLYPM